MNPLAWALVGAMAGAIAGSFLATLVLRWPEGRSILHGRSACDGCGRRLGPFDLIPLVSILALGGKCRRCGARIDPLHPLMELACAALGALALGIMPGPGGALWALFGWILLTLALLDWRHFWLPDALTLPLALAGLTVGEWASGVPLQDRVIGAAIGYGALLLIAVGYRRLRGRDGLGLGDAKLLGALGGWLGWQALPFILLAASGVGLLMVSGSALAGRRVDAQTRVPLGTCLALAALPGWWIARMLS